MFRSHSCCRAAAWGAKINIPWMFVRDRQFQPAYLKKTPETRVASRIHWIYNNHFETPPKFLFQVWLKSWLLAVRAKTYFKSAKTRDGHVPKFDRNTHRQYGFPKTACPFTVARVMHDRKRKQLKRSWRRMGFFVQNVRFEGVWSLQYNFPGQEVHQEGCFFSVAHQQKMGSPKIFPFDCYREGARHFICMCVNWWLEELQRVSKSQVANIHTSRPHPQST